MGAFAKRASYIPEFLVSISSREKGTLVPKQSIIMLAFGMAAKVIVEICDRCYPKQVPDQRYERYGKMAVGNCQNIRDVPLSP